MSLGYSGRAVDMCAVPYTGSVLAVMLLSGLYRYGAGASVLLRPLSYDRYIDSLGVGDIGCHLYRVGDSAVQLVALSLDG